MSGKWRPLILSKWIISTEKEMDCTRKWSRKTESIARRPSAETASRFLLPESAPAFESFLDGELGSSFGKYSECLLPLVWKAHVIGFHLRRPSFCWHGCFVPLHGRSSHVGRCQDLEQLLFMRSCSMIRKSSRFRETSVWRIRAPALTALRQTCDRTTRCDRTVPQYMRDRTCDHTRECSRTPKPTCRHSIFWVGGLVIATVTTVPPSIFHSILRIIEWGVYHMRIIVQENSYDIISLRTMRIICGGNLENLRGNTW